MEGWPVFDLYRRAWVAFRLFWPLMILLAILVEGIGYWFEGSTTASMSGTVVLILFAYWVHRYFLFEEKPMLVGAHKDGPPQRIGRFIVLSFLIIFLAVAAGIGVTVFLGIGLLHPSGRPVALLFMLIANLLLLSLFGTALPAAAAGDRFGFGVTLARGRRTFGQVFGGLLYGSGLVGAISYVAVAVAAVMIPENAPVAATLALNAAASVAGMVSSLLAVAVLCRAYRSLPADGPAAVPYGRA
jgi:hypothetical protein